MELTSMIWGLLSLASIIWVAYDVLTKNKSLTDVMKAAWIIVALLFGIIGALVYYFIGKKK